jgi:hypothetical protein
MAATGIFAQNGPFRESSGRISEAGHNFRIVGKPLAKSVSARKLLYPGVRNIAWTLAM